MLVKQHYKILLDECVNLQCYVFILQHALKIFEENFHKLNSVDKDLTLYIGV